MECHKKRRLPCAIKLKLLIECYEVLQNLKKSIFRKKDFLFNNCNLA